MSLKLPAASPASRAQVGEHKQFDTSKGTRGTQYFDLFGDDDAIEVAATLAAKKKAAEPAKPKKAAPIAKSIVLIEVKPCDDETDLDVLATRILAINKDGLVWKTEYKKEPIAYGIFKLIIGFVVEEVSDRQLAVFASLGSAVGTSLSTRIWSSISRRRELVEEAGEDRYGVAQRSRRRSRIGGGRVSW